MIFDRISLGLILLNPGGATDGHGEIEEVLICR